jgi:hypothetical protein
MKQSQPVIQGALDELFQLLPFMQPLENSANGVRLVLMLGKAGEIIQRFGNAQCAESHFQQAFKAAKLMCSDSEEAGRKRRLNMRTFSAGWRIVRTGCASACGT